MRIRKPLALGLLAGMVATLTVVLVEQTWNEMFVFNKSFSEILPGLSASLLLFWVPRAFVFCIAGIVLGTILKGRSGLIASAICGALATALSLMLGSHHFMETATFAIKFWSYFGETITLLSAVLGFLTIHFISLKVKKGGSAQNA